MRVLQLIDSLRPGGAERMAVNLANALVAKVEISFLCCTRQEGLLKETLNEEVKFLFLNKRRSLDLKAIWKLNKCIKRNKIDIIQAHGTSYFMGSLIKILNPRIKLIWHEHYGNRIAKKNKDNPLLYFSSFLFNGIIVVNERLLNWVRFNLKSNNQIYIPNFVNFQNIKFARAAIKKPYIHLVCLANLKEPKNHINLLKAFLLVQNKVPNCKLTLVGKMYGDIYELNIIEFLKNNNLGDKVVFAGEVLESVSILVDADVGVLSSDSEGLPMSLLEYGVAGLPVVCTDVGQCREVVGGNGRVVKVKDPEALAQGILFYIKNETAREQDSRKYQNVIINRYSEEKILPDFLSFYFSLKPKG